MRGGAGESITSTLLIVKASVNCEPVGRNLVLLCPRGASLYCETIDSTEMVFSFLENISTCIVYQEYVGLLHENCKGCYDRLAKQNSDRTVWPMYNKYHTINILQCMYRVGIGISVYMPCFVCMVINVHVPLENFSLICFKESATKCLPMHGTPGSSSVGSVSCQRLL